MQIKPKHFLTMLAVAGISMAALPANAATTFEPGDLLIGFRSNTNTTETLVVNITNGAFTNAAGVRDSNSNSGTVMANIGAALTDAFGADWATQTDLTWGVVGVYSSSSLDPAVDGDPARTLYISRANTAGTVGVQGSAALNVTGGNTAQNNIANAIAGFQQSFDTYGGTTQNGGDVAKIATSNVNTWEDFTSGSSDFGTGTNIEGVAGTSTGRVLDLYRILGTTTDANPTGPLRGGTWEGTISLGTNGDVTFTAAAVPEPSRAILALGGLTVLFMRRRRRA